VLLGGTPDWTVSSSIAEATAAMEADFGREADVVRIFHKWNDTFPSPGEQQLADSGHALFITVRAVDDNGTPISWRAIADAPVGSPLQQTMIRWARSVRDFSGRVFFNFHHEPEHVSNLANGNNLDYKAAFRRFVKAFRVVGASDVEQVWVMTNWSFRVEKSDPRAAHRWWPGTGFVDHLASDPFNWHTCRPEAPVRWESPKTLMQKFVNWSARYPDKGLILAEWGSVEDPTAPNRKANWINALRKLMRNGAGWERFIMISYYNLPQPGNPACAWELGSSWPAKKSFRRLARDPLYAD
jgi:hypothetical protein